jgi:hypothetical protein
VQHTMATWGAIQAKVGWWMDGTVLSNQMIVMGGGLLLAAALLMAIRRKTRVTLENSLMTQELMIYLSRIANALERLEPPSSDDVTANVLRRLEEIAHAKPNGKVREIPNH